MNDSRRMQGRLLIATLLLLGCNRGQDVNKEVEDLKRAQAESPKVASDLQRELDQKKAEVVKLEEKVALAKQGVTDDVEKEKNDLQHAMKREEEQVREKVQEAQGAAREQTSQSEAAARQLEQTEHAKRVRAEVKTETHEVPAQAETEVRTESKRIPVETTRVEQRTVETTVKDGGH